MHAQILYLSHNFPADLNLSEINARLLAGEISLNWRDVTADLSAEQSSLEQLLAGLNLVDHADTLGIATIIPEALHKGIYSGQ